MILIVDDKPEYIFSLKDILDKNGFKVITASSGEDALRKIPDHEYALIIIDLQIPDMDGFDLAEALSEFSNAKDAPIIFLSAINKEDAYIKRGYRSGGFDYVSLPIDPNVWLLKVKSFYKLSEQKRELIKIQNSLLKEVEARKVAEEELKLTMDDMRKVLESLPQIAFTIDREGEIEYVNKYWYEYSVNPKVFPEVHTDDEYVYADLEDAFANGVDLIREVRIRKVKTDDYIYHLLKIIPVWQNSTITRWAGTFTDIQVQKEANELLESKIQERTKELMHKNQELENTNHELQQFAWVASHDLKEPLRKIQTFNNLLKDKYMNDNTEAARYLDRTIKSSKRMSDLIDNLLEYSRLSVSSLFEPTDLNTVLSDILTDLELAIIEKNAKITFDRMPVIEAVPGQIRQVFQNLVSNSLKFSKKDTAPEIHIKSEVLDEDPEDDFSCGGDYCQITISDNGIGFNEKYTDKIFAIFQRLHTREMYDGTGIGLAITKKIVDKHNGKISAYGKENEGAVFTIALPIKQANGNHSAQQLNGD